jgi:hypothetical protein
VAAVRFHDFLHDSQPQPGPDGHTGAFNPNALGNYQFAITVSSGSFPLDSVAMEVQVIPVPAAVWLFGSALGLFGVMRRRAMS